MQPESRSDFQGGAAIAQISTTHARVALYVKKCNPSVEIIEDVAELFEFEVE